MSRHAAAIAVDGPDLLNLLNSLLGSSLFSPVYQERDSQEGKLSDDYKKNMMMVLPKQGWAPASAPNQRLSFGDLWVTSLAKDTSAWWKQYPQGYVVVLTSGNDNVKHFVFVKDGANFKLWSSSLYNTIKTQANPATMPNVAMLASQHSSLASRMYGRATSIFWSAAYAPIGAPLDLAIIVNHAIKDKLAEVSTGSIPCASDPAFATIQALP